MNAVVSRRLAWIADQDDRAKLADRFAKGESLKKLADEVGLSTTRLGYCLVQDLVERDAVPANAPKTLMWVSCQTHRTPQSISKVAREAAADLAEIIG